jgi:hypothetical protein
MNCRSMRLAPCISVSSTCRPARGQRRRVQLDVGAPARHVRRDRDRRRPPPLPAFEMRSASSLSKFALSTCVLQPAQLQQAAEQLARPRSTACPPARGVRRGCIASMARSDRRPTCPAGCERPAGHRHPRDRPVGRDHRSRAWRRRFRSRPPRPPRCPSCRTRTGTCGKPLEAQPRQRLAVGGHSTPLLGLHGLVQAVLPLSISRNRPVYSSTIMTLPSTIW